MDFGSGEGNGVSEKEETLFVRNGVYGYRDQTGGRDVRRSLRTNDEAEARKRLTAIRVKQSSTRHLYSEAAGAWVLSAQASKTPKTWRRYKQSLLQLEPYFLTKHLDEIDKQAVLRFVEARKAEKRSIATIRRDLTVLSGILENAIEREWITINPTRLLPKRPLRYKPPVFRRAPLRDIEALLAQCSPALQAICEFYLETGMRLDEARTLTMDHVDLLAATARLDDTKNHTVRTISLTPRAVEIVRAQGVKSGIVFRTREGTQHKAISETVREAGYKAQKQAQSFVRYSPHDFRHEYAIRYLEKGGNLYALQRQLGHGSIKQTEHYLQFLPPERAIAAVTQAGTPERFSAPELELSD